METAVSIRKILRFLMYSLVVLGVLLCGMDVAFGQAEQVVGIIYGIGLWVLILKVIHAVLGKVANAHATPKCARAYKKTYDDDAWLRPDINPATGLPMMGDLLDVGGNLYGTHRDD